MPTRGCICSVRGLLRSTVLLVLLTGAAAAQEHRGPIHVDAAWSRELPPVSANGAAYLSLRNTGATADALVGVETPAAARAEVHEHAMEAGVMRMRRVDVLALPAGQSVRMAPGGLHVMLLDLREPLRRGDRFPVTLHFRDAAAMEVQVEVRSLGEEAPGHSPARGGHGHDGGHGEKKH